MSKSCKETDFPNECHPPVIPRATSFLEQWTGHRGFPSPPLLSRSSRMCHRQFKNVFTSVSTNTDLTWEFSVAKILKNVSQATLEIFISVSINWDLTWETSRMCHLQLLKHMYICLLKPTGKPQEEGWKEKYPGLRGNLVELECQGEYQVWFGWNHEDDDFNWSLLHSEALKYLHWHWWWVLVFGSELNRF